MPTVPGINLAQTESLILSAQQLFKLDRAAAQQITEKYGPLLANASIAAAAGNVVAQEALEDYAAQLKLDLADLAVTNEQALEGKIQGYLVTGFSFLRMAV